MLAKTPNPTRLPHLPPHLREVCALLATGLLRLRRHTAADITRDAAQAGERGEVSLHFHPKPSVHANPNPGRPA